MSGQSYAKRLLEAAVTIAAVAWLLAWSWRTVRPLVPVLAAVCLVLVVGRLLLNRWRY